MGFDSTHQISSRASQRPPARAKNLAEHRTWQKVSVLSQVYLRRNNVKVAHGTLFSYTLDQTLQISVLPTEVHLETFAELDPNDLPSSSIP